MMCATPAAIPQDGERTIQGTVRAANGEGLRGVIVQLKDPLTLAIRSFITPSGGAFRFTHLSAQKDYELKAMFHDQWTDTKYVSRFSEGDPLTVDLTIKPPQ